MKILLPVFSLCSIISGQVIIEPGGFFQTVFENGAKVNPYYVGYNPAYLRFDGRDRLLTIQSAFNNSEGDFKRFVAPGKIRQYQLSFSGEKILDSAQVFRGIFAVQRDERHKWNWLSTKNYNLDSPFLLGDSTSGRTRYNGILMKAEYGNKLWNKILTGFSLEYGVDEGLKEISPRPTTEHRDIDFSFGFGYLISKNLSAGFSLRAYDFNEKISYKEDLGGLLQETIIFKFRGFDFPIILKKKTETRYSFHNGYSGTLNFFFFNEKLSFATFIAGGVEQITIKDGSNNPIPEGYWKNNKYEGAVSANLILSEKLKAGIFYKFNYKNMWAKHPSFNVLLMENTVPNNILTIGLEFRLRSDLSIGIESGLDFTRFDYKDYYSGITWKSDMQKYLLRTGTDYRWNNYLDSFIGYGFTKNIIGEKSLQQYNNSDYFNNFRIDDIQYFITGGIKHSLYSKTTLDSGSGYFLVLYLAYDSFRPVDSAVFGNTSRNYLNAILEMKIKVY